MGDRPELDHIWAAERRARWHRMGLLRRLDGLLHGVRIARRDGVNVSKTLTDFAVMR